MKVTATPHLDPNGFLLGTYQKVNLCLIDLDIMKNDFRIPHQRRGFKSADFQYFSKTRVRCLKIVMLGQHSKGQK